MLRRPCLDQDLDHQHQQQPRPYFCSSTSAGHLQCQNPQCDYLQRAHQTSLVNDIDFNSVTKGPFPICGPLPTGSDLMCRIRKEPPNCIAPCIAKIFYVHGNDTTQRACIHLGNHPHSIKIGNYKNSRKHIDALIEEHVEWISQATHNKNVLQANKDLAGEFFLRSDSNPPGRALAKFY